MTYRTGANTYIGVQMTSVWSQAVAAGTGDKWEVENFNYSENPETLVANPIGSGSEMINESTKGATSPTIDASCIGQFSGPAVRLEALLFGTADGPYSTAAATAFTHSIMYNSTRPAKYACIGWHTSSATSMEIPSALPSRLRVTGANPPAWEMREFSLLGDNIDITPTNTAATLATTTLESTKRVVVRPSDYFRINAQAGAGLSSSDNVSITSFEITYDRALEHVREIRGATDQNNAEPRQASSPPFNVTLTVTLRSAADHTYWTAQQADPETEYKCEIGITGELISDSTYYLERRLFPRVKLIAWPDAPLSSGGENPLTLRFTVLEASAAPTGMITTKPHVVYTNLQTGSLLAM